MLLRTAIASLCCLALWAAPAHAQSVQLAEYPGPGQSFDTPFYVAAPPGDASRVFVVEAEGTVRLVKNGAEQPTPFLSIAGEVHLPCECGMFSIAFAPGYAASGLVYATYTRDNGTEHDLVLEEFRRSAANPDVVDPASRRVVMTIPHNDGSNHNGGQLQFGPDGYLYWSTGDGGGQPALAQSLTTRLGKLLRIDPRGSAPGQYSIPADNPFVDGPGGNADEVYAYGLRNPYRFSFDRATGDLTLGDVGGSSFEEIDFMPEGTARGANFGWPCFEGFQVNSTGGICAGISHTPPVHTYVNDGGGAAVMGGFVVRDSALPSLAGRYLFADTYGAVSGIRAITLAPGASSGESGLGFGATSTVSFGQDSCGHLYVASQGGEVFRLQPSSGGFPCKLAPVVKASVTGPRKARRRGGILARVNCDEDCTAVATGSVVIGGRNAGKSSKLAGKKASRRVQRGTPTKLFLDLTKKEVRRLTAALQAGKRVRVKVRVSATGGGGGTATAVARAPKAKKKKKRR